MSRPGLGAPATVHLRSLPAFEALGSQHLEGLAEGAHEVVVPRGRPLLRRGQGAEALHLILDGLVEAGEDMVVGPGGLVGFLEVLAGAASALDAVTETDVIALRIDAEPLRRACERSFPVLAGLLADVAGRVLEERHPLLRSIVGRGARGVHPDGEGPLDRVARMVALHRSPVFRSESMDALAELSGHLEEWRLERGDALWQVGEPAFGFYVVASGDVHLGGGPWRAGDHLGPGSVPGLIGTLSGRRYEYSAFASEPSVLLHVRAQPFMDVLEDHFELAWEMLGRLARNLLEAGSGTAGVRGSVAEDGGAGRSPW